LVPSASGMSDGPHYVQIVHGGTPDTHVDIDGLLVRRRPRSWLPAVSALGLLAFGFAVWFVAHRRRARTG